GVAVARGQQDQAGEEQRHQADDEIPDGGPELLPVRFLAGPLPLPQEPADPECASREQEHGGDETGGEAWGEGVVPRRAVWPCLKLTTGKEKRWEQTEGRSFHTAPQEKTPSPLPGHPVDQPAASGVFAAAAAVRQYLRIIAAGLLQRLRQHRHPVPGTPLINPLRQAPHGSSSLPLPADP